jgi:Flp pilus assembly pilin Flp
MLRLRRFLLNVLADESGQNIVEYCAVIAFVGVIIALAFNLAQGSLFVGLSQSFSSVPCQLNNVNSYVSSGS